MAVGGRLGGLAFQERVCHWDWALNVKRLLPFELALSASCEYSPGALTPAAMLPMTVMDCYLSRTVSPKYTFSSIGCLGNGVYHRNLKATKTLNKIQIEEKKLISLEIRTMYIEIKMAEASRNDS